MTYLTLYLGDSDTDEAVKQMLESWKADNPDIILEYLSIHAVPTAIVRLGITELPALVLQEEIIAQGAPTNWVLSLLDRVFANLAND